MASLSAPGADSCRLCADDTVCRVAVGERLVPLCPECLVLVLADGQVALALELARTGAPVSPRLH
jgi:hypothetical protein